MGDELGDEWWLQDENTGVSNVNEDTQNTEPAAEKSTEKSAKKRRKETKDLDKAKKRKTVQKECFIGKEQKAGDEAGDRKSKKRRKKKTITDVLADSEPVPGSPADLRGLLQSHFAATRSLIEQEELCVPETSFLSSNDLTHSLSSYLKEVCPKWAKAQKQHKQTHSVLLLIICSSALRTIELIKQLTSFKGEAKVVKLFAKHIKVEDQLKMLSKSVVHIGVGTPARVNTLIHKDGLSLQGLRYLVLDWNYRDQKKRRMVDIPEVKAEFLKLMESGIIKKCQEDLKIGLF